MQRARRCHDGFRPFPHLSIHLPISEWLGIDQPRAIKQAFDLLAARLGPARAALHRVSAKIWRSDA